MNSFRSCVTKLADPNCKDDLKLKATQEINENLEVSLLWVRLICWSWSLFFAVDFGVFFLSDVSGSLHQDFLEGSAGKWASFHFWVQYSTGGCFVSWFFFFFNKIHVCLLQVRKLILEILNRLPTNDLLRPYVKAILSLVLKLLEIDNEENVLVCLKIIIELHKQYRPTFNAEVSHLLFFCFSFCYSFFFPFVDTTFFAIC